jgi:hypothetical protein
VQLVLLDLLALLEVKDQQVRQVLRVQLALRAQQVRLALLVQQRLLLLVPLRVLLILVLLL